MKTILYLIISGALVVSGFGQTRNVLVGTNNTVVQPTNFWNANASDARNGLGLGSIATNSSSSFQSSSSVLSNLASSNGANLTNIPLAGVVGALATNGNAANLTNFPANLLRTNGSANGLTNFPTSLLATNGNGAGLTNLTAANIAGTVGLASNVTGTIAISNGGTGATNAGGARTNLGLGITNDVQFGRVFVNGVLDVYSVASGAVEVFKPILIADRDSTNAVFQFEVGSDAAIARANLGLGGTNNVVFNSLHAEQDASSGVYSLTIGQTNTGFRGTGGGGNDFVFARNGTNLLGFTSGSLQSFVAHSFSAPLVLNYGAGQTSVISFGGIDAATGAAISRTNLGLGWPALTNSNAGTSLVSVNTNGEVVSPTNFWQVSPANTRVQLIQPVTTSTNTATNARNLYLYSLAISTTGVTNTIQLPTNGGTLLGDVATVIHEGPTSSVTAVRQTGAGSNIITLNQFQEAVKFIYESGGWRLADNISYVESIYFSGTNAAANAAESRTNLGLGNTNNVEFGALSVGGDFYVDNGGVIKWGGTNGLDRIEIETRLFLGGEWTFDQGPIEFGGGTNRALYQAQTRTNLGLGATWLTNTNVTNFRTAIGLGSSDNVSIGEDNGSITTDNVNAANIDVAGAITFTNAAATRTNLGLGATNNVTFSNVTASGTLTATSTVTAKTNLVVEGHLDFTTNATNSNPATNNQINDFIEIRVGTNQFWLPVYK